MKKHIYSSITELIGHTPMVEITGIEGQKARIAVKIEFFNPGGSAKDRIAFAMIEDAEKNGMLLPGATIIEPTSGNTGVGLAWVGAARGYKTIFTMPETMSIERQNMLKAFGAQVVLTHGSDGMQGAIDKANELKDSINGAVILGQFVNQANPEAHERTTGEEIWEDSEGQVDIFIAGVGTGGTLCGTAKTLKKHKPSVKAIAVEPASSAVLSTGKAGSHKIQGIGGGFVPDTYNARVVDKIVTVTDEDAYEYTRFMARNYGILVGISSGAAFFAAVEEAKKDENENKLIVALLPDTGERYLSTGVFE